MECGYADVQQVQYIENALFHALASACAERSSVEFFGRSSSSLASDIKKELISFMSEQVRKQALEEQQDPNEATSERVCAAMDAFVGSKRSLLGRVSSTLGGASKQDRIQELLDELDRAGIWPLGQREALAKSLLKLADVKGTSHCTHRFATGEELAAHAKICNFRPVTCENVGCAEVLSAIHLVSHDSRCLYKLLPCEQKCDKLVTRGEMNAHCTGVCPMKLVSCAFATVGCSQVVPQGSLCRHLEEFVSDHLMLVLASLKQQGALVASHEQRVSLLEKAVSLTQRSEKVDVGSLSLTVKEQQAKIKKLEAEVQKLRTELKKDVASVQSKIALQSTALSSKTTS